jgi:hypothetical protein
VLRQAQTFQRARYHWPPSAENHGCSSGRSAADECLRIGAGNICETSPVQCDTSEPYISRFDLSLDLRKAITQFAEPGSQSVEVCVCGRRLFLPVTAMKEEYELGNMNTWALRNKPELRLGGLISEE